LKTLELQSQHATQHTCTRYTASSTGMQSQLPGGSTQQLASTHPPVPSRPAPPPPPWTASTHNSTAGLFAPGAHMPPDWRWGPTDRQRGTYVMCHHSPQPTAGQWASLCLCRRHNWRLSCVLHTHPEQQQGMWHRAADSATVRRQQHTKVTAGRPPGQHTKKAWPAETPAYGLATRVNKHVLVLRAGRPSPVPRPGPPQPNPRLNLKANKSKPKPHKAQAVHMYMCRCIQPAKRKQQQALSNGAYCTCIRCVCAMRAAVLCAGCCSSTGQYVKHTRWRQPPHQLRQQDSTTASTQPPHACIQVPGLLWKV
jgi:hypothetical protein